MFELDNVFIIRIIFTGSVRVARALAVSTSWSALNVVFLTCASHGATVRLAFAPNDT